MGLERSYKEGEDIPPLSKEVTQEKINLFEGSSGRTGPSQFTDEETAQERLGTRGTIASGRVTLTFALELLRRYFGSDVYNRTGMVDVRFLRPARPGDTITLTGTVTSVTREANGSRVAVNIIATNQNGDPTGAGTGSAVVPSGYMPTQE